MKNNPYQIVKMFEDEISYYTGAPYVVTIDSCTNALFLICKYLNVKEVTIPSQTYQFLNQLYMQVEKLYLIKDLKQIIGKEFIN